MIINIDKSIKVYTDFYIINDSNYININNNQIVILNKLKNMIHQYNMNVIDESLEIIALDLYKLIKSIPNFQESDLLLGMGTGGKMIGKIIKDYFPSVNVLNINLKRIWENDKTSGFEYDFPISALQNKNIILLDDVIVTGKSVNVLIKELNKINCKVLGCLVGVTNVSFTRIKFKHNVVVSRVVYGKRFNNCSLDPLWYPAIFSIRHLLNHENGMDNFGEIVSDKYFFRDENITNLLNDLYI